MTLGIEQVKLLGFFIGAILALALAIPLLIFGGDDARKAKDVEKYTSESHEKDTLWKSLKYAIIVICSIILGVIVLYFLVILQAVLGKRKPVLGEFPNPKQPNPSMVLYKGTEPAPWWGGTHEEWYSWHPGP